MAIPNLTEAQKAAILDVCKHLISTGIAFAYQKNISVPEYPAERGMAEIIKILEGDTNG